jgi:hypothetical protein
MNIDNDDKKLLNEIVSKKNEVENYVRKLDTHIYDLENKYLESTQNIGNILKGWDQFFTTKPKNLPSSLNPTNKKLKFSNNERIFSQCSYNNQRMKDDTYSQANNILRNSTVLTNPTKLNPLRRKKKLYSSLSLKKKRISLSKSVEKDLFQG